MTQHTGDTINKLTEAVERAEKRASWFDPKIGERDEFDTNVEFDNSYRPEEEEHYPGRAFPGVEDESDLQSMLDELAAEHERQR